MSEYYAFKNKRTGRFIAGTDFNAYPRRQISADENRPPMLFIQQRLEVEQLMRKINDKSYKVVKVKIVEVEE